MTPPGASRCTGGLGVERLLIMLHSFPQRSIKTWNNLTDDLIIATSVHKLQERLDENRILSMNVGDVVEHSIQGKVLDAPSFWNILGI